MHTRIVGPRKRTSTTKEEPLAEAKRLCSSLNLYDLVLGIGAFYAFNREPIGYVPPHYAIDFALKNSRASQNRLASTRDISKILNLMRDARESMLPCVRLNEDSTDLDKPDKPKSHHGNLDETSTIRAASCHISNPGSIGQMICYALDKYAPFDTMIERHLGFDTVRAFRSMRLLQMRLGEQMYKRLSPETLRKLSESRRGLRRALLRPPDDFMRAYKANAKITPDLLDMYEAFFGESLEDILVFLSADVMNAGLEGGFLSRWCFLRDTNQNYLLPLPQSLIETLIGAIHIELLESLGDAERGAYGRQIGRVFEDIVAERFRVYLPKARVTPRKKLMSRGKPSDIDVCIELPDSSIIAVQCRARLLRPKGRWDKEEYFEADVVRNIIDASSQMHSTFDADSSLMEMAVTAIVVLEAYFPMSVNFIQSDSSIGRAMKGLPNPIIISLYDLEFMMWLIPESRFLDYLAFRMKVLESRKVNVIDESDLCELYRRHGDDSEFFSRISSRPISAWVADYGPFDLATLHAADIRLGILENSK